MSEAVWQNTQRSMVFDGTTTAREWAAKATGVHLRWEVIGLVFSVVGLIAMDWDPLFSSGREQVIVRKTLARKMFSASDACLAICNELEVLNDMYLCLLYENSVLTALTKGDANPVAWQRSGELASALIAMGLHQEIKVNKDTPLFLAELRKKTFISAYGQDKSVATFLGRPPRLSARYCLLQPPLALSDTQVLSEGAELEAALASLDDDGWSKNGEMNRCTLMRAWLRFSRIREEILEISLGVSNEDIALQAEFVIREVGRRSEQMWAALPAYLRFDPDTIWQSGMAPISVIFLIAIYTDYLHNGFLLQRALIKRIKTDTQRLIPIARQMLGLVLTTWSKRDYLRDFQGDMVYILSTHGLPSAGVLAVELLKQEQSHHVSQEILPRSEAIQDLSVFIAALASLGPGEGNYAACEQGRRALKRILDKILSPNPVPAMAPAVTDQAPVADLSMYLNAGNDADFLQWLENMEWDKGPLLNTS
ncbi:hypothetical protein B0A49_03641 [Cryomyces minteri]|uniref:Xylanolytic transcriptional activator regulatory domain-containing protein n=1 Tax=Cryomyces minteri TaxID=331657 RepID=A0A4U0XJ14_9PEZI|nr:hypothetical protein B0A49_03641 [Cryomyces minteri]